MRARVQTRARKYAHDAVQMPVHCDLAGMDARVRARTGACVRACVHMVHCITDAHALICTACIRAYVHPCVRACMHALLMQGIRLYRYYTEIFGDIWGILH